VKWRTGCEGRVSRLKHQYGWDRTRIDSLEGARRGVFTSNLVKIAGPHGPCVDDRHTRRIWPRTGREHPGARRLGSGSARIPRYRRASGRPFGEDMTNCRTSRRARGARRPVLPTAARPAGSYPWLASALVGQWGPLTRGDHLDRGDLAADPDRGWSVAQQDHRATGRLREATADPEKVLVNALRTVHRAGGALIRWLVARTNTVPRVGGGDGISGVAAQINTGLRTSVRSQRIERVQEPRTGQGQRIPARNPGKIAALPRKP